MAGKYFIVLFVQLSSLALCQDFSGKNWDLLYSLKNERNVRLTEDVTLRLHSTTNYSQFFLSAKQIFQENILPESLVVIVKLRIRKRLIKPVVLLGLKNLDDSIGLKLSLKPIPGSPDKLKLNVVFNPIYLNGNQINHDFILPFTNADIWSLGVLLKRDKIVIYTTCDDIKRPFGYQSVNIPKATNQIFFKDGAIFQFFSEDYKFQKLKGEIYEFSFSNSVQKLNFLCYNLNVEGSGNQKFKMDKTTPGNGRLITPKMEDPDIKIKPKSSMEFKATEATIPINEKKEEALSIKINVMEKQRLIPKMFHKNAFKNISQRTDNENVLTESKIVHVQSSMSNKNDQIQSDSTLTTNDKVTTPSSYIEAVRFDNDIIQAKTDPPESDSSRKQDTSSQPATRTEQSTEARMFDRKGETESPDQDENLKDENCDLVKKLRLLEPQKGQKGEYGPKGDLGEKGNPGPPGHDGMCDYTICKLNARKGDKGDPGVCSSTECPLAKDMKGPKGQKGQKGSKGEKGESDQINPELIKSLAASVLQSELESMSQLKNIKGERGDPGVCNCNSQRSNNMPSAKESLEESVNVGFGSLVFEDKEALEKVSAMLPPGSMVFIVKSDLFLIKTDQLNNAWRTIFLESKSKDWIFSSSILTSKPDPLPTPYPNGFAKKLHLIALPLPTMGDLKTMLRQPGGYSGAAFQCQQAGATYGFGRHMHPFINTDMFSIKFVIKENYKNLPIFNTRGEILSNDYLSLLSENEVLMNDILDFKRNSISTNVMSPCVWIGKEPNKYEYEKSSEFKCLNWMTRDPISNGLASMVYPDKSLFDEQNKQLRPCSQQCYVLCIQTEPHDS